MQLLEDKDLVNFGDMGKRIAALRKRVEFLLENRVATSGEPEIRIVEKVVEKIVEVPTETGSTEDVEKLLQENLMLKRQLENTEVPEDVDSVIQENIMLKKQVADREKTIKELDFKLEMFKLAKSLREGAGISTKSDELKKIINEYIKEIDKSIKSLNIE